MACTNSTVDINNAFHAGYKNSESNSKNDKLPTLTLSYGAYMN